MAYDLILDENVEHEVYYRLENYGHNVEHVDFVPELGKGISDHPIAQYSRETDRVIVTYDDDFVLKLTGDDYQGVLYVQDASLSVGTVADLIDNVATHYPQTEITGVEYIGEEWL
jgi:predicted nuclease of predicted toxin-antitoxin system